MQSGLGDVQNLTGSYSVTDLGTLYATGINNSGQVVVGNDDYNRRALLYSDGKITDLGTVTGGSISSATDINDSGQVVGSAFINNIGIGHAFLETNNQITDLGTLPNGGDSYATSINKSGQVVGYANILEYHAPYDSEYYAAYDINGFGYQNEPYTRHNDGYYSDLGVQHAFIDSNGHLTDLNSLIPKESGWTLELATAMNNFGQIVGNGEIGGQQHAFLLNPISTSTPKDGITVGNITT